MTRRRWLVVGGLAVSAAVAVAGAAVLVLDDDPVVVPPPEVELPQVPVLSDATLDMAIDPVEAAPATVADDPLEYAWQQRAIGGGGWVKGIEIHPSGEPVIARTDVGGAYRLDRATDTWRQLILDGAVDDLRPVDYHVDSIALAPSDPDWIYLAVGEADAGGTVEGRVLVSRDGGTSWTSSDQPVVVHGNGRSRNGGERMAVSPVDPRDVWLGGSAGLLRSRDGGSSFQPVETAPAGNREIAEQRGVEWVLVGPDAAVVYIGVSGAGVHRSLDDGATWDELWAAPGRPFDAELDADGKLWAVDEGDGHVRRFDPDTGVVAEVDNLRGQDLRGIAVRADGTDVVVAVPDALWRSTDSGLTWARTGLDFSCPDIRWQDEYPFDLYTASSPEFDPLEPATLWIPEGFGIWSLADVAADSIEFECRVDGVEQIVVNDLVTPASDVVIAASWDRALFHLPAGGPETATVGPSNRFNGGWSLATTPADDAVIAAVVADHRFCCEADGLAYQSGRSFDGGLTWEPFGSYGNGSHPQDLRFGNIAISADNVDNLVWLPTFNAPLHYTVDGGDTWVPVILPGTEDRVRDDGVNAGGSHFEFYLRREVLVADPVAPSTFYLFHQDLGLFATTDGGASWQLRSADGLPTGWTAGWFNAELAAVPDREGHLIYTPGQLLEAVFPMYESRDGGSSWSPVVGTSAADAFGFGAPIEGSTEPTVYLVGSVNAERGIYRSDDLMATWEVVDTSAGGIAAAVTSVTGDPGIPGRVYVGFAGVSVMQGDDVVGPAAG